MSTIFKRAMSIVLSAVMISFPMSSFAAEGGGTEALMPIESGANALRDYKTRGDGGYDHVYYGGLKWRVLDTANDTNDSAEGVQRGIFLLSEYVLNYGQGVNGYRSYSDRDGRLGSTDGDTTKGYYVSDMRKYLTGEGTYTKFRSARSVYREEAPTSSYNIFFYINKVSDGELAIGPSGDKLYYTRDVAPNEGYVKETMELNSATFVFGGYYKKSGEGEYTRAYSYEEGVDYYYDTATYSHWDSRDASGDLKATFDYNPNGYYVFDNISNQNISTERDNAINGTFCYVGYRTTGSTRPVASAVTRTTVSDTSAARTNFMLDYGITAIEQSSAMPTYKTEPPQAKQYLLNNRYYYGGSLFGDRYFLLSAAEAGSIAYGMNLTQNRVATTLNGTYGSYWWLRSSNTINNFGTIHRDGSFYGNSAISNYMSTRPAFNLNPDSVAFISRVGAKSGVSESFSSLTTGREDTWKLTLKDLSLGVDVGTITQNGNTYSASYSNATAYGDNVYLSAVLTASIEGKAIYGYTKLMAITDSSKTAGNISFNMPVAKVGGVDTQLNFGNCSIKIFLEKCNGDKECDYASRAVTPNIIVDGTEYGPWQYNNTSHWREAVGGEGVLYEAEHRYTH